MPFWRSQDRLPVEMEVDFRLVDDRLRLISSAFVPATMQDVSSSGKA